MQAGHSIHRENRPRASGSHTDPTSRSMASWINETRERAVHPEHSTMTVPGRFGPDETVVVFNR